MYSYPRYQKPSYTYPAEEYYYQPGGENDYRHHQHFYEDSPRSGQQIERPLNRKKHRRSKSFSKMNYFKEEFNNYSHHPNSESDYYYHGPHRLDGVRSVSPFTENRHYHHNSINRRMDNEEAVTNNRRRVQPTCFVNLNQPMINPMTTNYCMQQSLGTCPTENWPTVTTNAYVPPNNDFFFIPQNVPMIQPYFMNQPNNSNNFLASSYYQPVFPTFMPMPTLHPDIIPQASMAEEVPTPTTKQISPVVDSKEIVTDYVPPAPPQPPVLLRRKKSLMEEILSSFSLLGEGVNYAPTSKTQKPDDDGADNTKSKTTTWDHTSYTSLSDALDNGNGSNGEKKHSSLSRKTSLKLFKKANALQNRQYIWCYRPFQQKQTIAKTNKKEELSGLWAAFDMTNQVKLDYHYSFIMNKKSHDDTNQKPKIENNLPDMITDDPSLILMLNRQSTISNPVMVSLGDGIAWYYTMKDENDPDCNLLEIGCLPTHHHRLVVSNDLLNSSQEEVIKPLRRSKSMDGLGSNLLNTVFGW